jgi:hypothetical protein
MTQNPLQGIPHRVWITGIFAGLLVIGLCGLFPDRFLMVAVYTGLGLTLTNITAMLLASAKGAWLEWPGLAPVLVMIIGSVLVLAASLQVHFEPHQIEPYQGPVTAVNATRPQMSAGLPLESAPVARPPQHENPASPSNRSQPTALLAEIHTILNLKVRQALFEVRASLSGEREPETLRSQLKSATDDLVEAQSSLEKIISQNQDISGELASVIEDTTTLAELNGALREFVDSLGNSEGTPPAEVSRSIAAEVPTLRTLEVNTMKWVGACNKRITEARAAATGSSPGQNAQ